MDAAPPAGQPPAPSPATPARGWAGFAVFSLLLPAILLGAAGRPDWIMGWVYVGTVSALTLGTRLRVQRTHPGLLDERARSLGRADTKSWDRVLLGLFVGLGTPAMWLTAGLGQRWGWLPAVPVGLQLAALVALLLGGLLSAWAMLANRFFSAVVRVQHDRGHTVVTTGPYRVVRHPGYAGTVLFNLATPLALGSCQALVPAGVVVAALLVRTVLEERTLRAELPGYVEYARRTRYRMLPGVF